MSLASPLTPRDEHVNQRTTTLTLSMHEKQIVSSTPAWCGLARLCIQGEHLLEKADSVSIAHW